MKVYIILWSYGDNSAFGIVDVFLIKDEAYRMLQKLEEFGDRQFEIKEFDVLGNPQTEPLTTKQP